MLTNFAKIVNIFKQFYNYITILIVILWIFNAVVVHIDMYIQEKQEAMYTGINEVLLEELKIQSWFGQNMMKLQDVCPGDVMERAIKYVLL